MDYSKIRGFNYQPSYGSTGLEIWQKFDASIIDLELGRGKKHFPKMNAIRLWLSWDAFLRNPALFAERFDQAIAIADRHGLKVMVVLFNRWHCPSLDYGGIYIDHFIPGLSWVNKPDMFQPFMEAIVGGHADDQRIFAWDLCNEPFAYWMRPDKAPQDMIAYEFAWLEDMYNTCKRLGAVAPVTVGVHGDNGDDGAVDMKKVEPISDFLSIHPYWKYDSPPHDKGEYEQGLDEQVAFAQSVGKGILATETCWGAQDDAKRAEMVRYTLDELTKRNIGFLAYLLHHSLIADAHRIEYGPLREPGNLMFIEADGSLRPGHGVFNDFC